VARLSNELWTSCLNRCVHVTKQYNLVPVSGRWHSVAGKVTVGWHHIGHALLVQPCRGSRHMKERDEHLACTLHWEYDILYHFTYPPTERLGLFSCSVTWWRRWRARSWRAKSWCRGRALRSVRLIIATTRTVNFENTCRLYRRSSVNSRTNTFRGRSRSNQLHTYVTVICGHVTISMLWGNTAYCLKLSGKDLSRYSNKIESVGGRKFPYDHCFTKKVISQ